MKYCRVTTFPSILIFILITMNDSYSQTIRSNNKPVKILFPFSIEIDPMEKLLLVNFEKDPDSTYVGFEPQVFNDDKNGKGHLVIGWRTDKKIDVYYQKSLSLDSSKYSIAGAGLNRMIPVDMDIASYEVDDFGVQAHYKFNDFSGRDVEIVIKENNSKKRKPFGLLAPMGDAATNPKSMPLVLLHDFYFARKKQTEILVSIANKTHKVDALPILMDFQKMTFARYSPKPLIATLNPEHKGELETLDLEIGQTSFGKGEKIYEVEWSNQSASIKSMSVKNNIHPLTMSFAPSFPDLNTFPTNTSLNGNFIISGHESVGSISGEYQIHSDKESITLSAIPTKGWKPKTTKFSTWFLFTFAKVFRKWPTTYRWDAEIRKNEQGRWQMQSTWKQTGKILNG